MYYKIVKLDQLGDVVFLASEEELISITHTNQAEFNNIVQNNILNNNLELFILLEEQLNRYFNKQSFDFNVFKKNLLGTSFQKQVWEELLKIPYGQTTTYKEIANCLSKNSNVKKMSFRAVGTAIGKNPILVIVPCHRVIGSDDKLRGFAAGLMIKKILLDLEGSKYIE